METKKKNKSLLKKTDINDKDNQPSIGLFEETEQNLKFEEVFQERGDYSTNALAGIYFQGVQYFDFKNVYFINNTGIANLIDLLKTLLKQGVVIKFVNVGEKIRDKFKSMGLEFIFNCS